MSEVKMYFKGTSGITNPVDIDGTPIVEGDTLTRDYGDRENYRNEPTPDHYKTEPFYLVKPHKNGGLFAESIEFMKGGMFDNKRFYLHDFRFKHCKKLPPNPLTR